MKISLWLPFQRSLISQGFGQNANGSYAEQGLLGHPAIDFAGSYGSPLYNTHANAYCYSTINKDHQDPMKYRAICTIIETESGVYEVIYGHASKITAVPGKTYQPGDILGEVGNTGLCYVDGRLVTKEEKLAGSHAGAHLHYQVRILEKVKKKTGRKLVMDGNGVFKKDGYFYEIVSQGNGYAGCVSPNPYFNNYLAKDAKKVMNTIAQMIELLKALLGTGKPS